MRLQAIGTLLLAATAFAAERYQCRIEVLVDGAPRPEYSARGTTYIEALKGKEYAIRITNPFGVRVAVALAVDGLNTIDARHTTPQAARKWVLYPYQTITISGWQTSQAEARRFYFTSERDSYGAWLGKTQNLGVISAVFFRERAPLLSQAPPASPYPLPRYGAGARAEASRDAKERAASRPAEDDYAATGIGRGMSHLVTRIHMDLEDQPAAVVNIRYEYRPALVALGIVPAPEMTSDPIRRRERSRGFEEYCPVPR
jgi:hypothetical protein